MPLYEYRCDCGAVYEVQRIIAERTLPLKCPCGRKAYRSPSTPAVHFKGSGFHCTDYPKK